MSATVIVNGLTLTHKGTGGMSVATVPDVCLTPAPPGPPLPIPYPNIALNTDLAQGTTTVTADGGNMIAIRGSQLLKSSGDEPGVNGGVMSGVNMKETGWITYSMDVNIDGANACRLTDKLFHNHNNTVNMAGKLDPPPWPRGSSDAEFEYLCKILCYCLENPKISATGRSLHQGCVEEMLRAQTEFPKVTPSQGYDPGVNGGPPTPRADQGNGMRAPDSMIKNDPAKPATQDNIKYLVEMKFQKPGYCDVYSEKQQKRDKDIVGEGNKDKIVLLTPSNCGCPPGGGPGEPTPGDGLTDTRFAECEDEETDEPVPAVENSGIGVEGWTAIGLLAAAAAEALLELLGIEAAEGAGAAPRRRCPCRLRHPQSRPQLQSVLLRRLP